MRHVVAVAAVFLAALLSAGCGSDDNGSAGATTSGPGQTVELKASEYAFDPSNVNIDAAGKVTFTVANDGQQTHALEVEGDGIEEEMDSVSPGDSGTLTVDLQPGTYEFYCPIDGHRDEGMEGTLVVGGAGAGTSTGSSTDEGATTEDSGYGG